MKAIRASLVLGLFIFMITGARAQNGIKRINKNQVKSSQAPQKIQGGYQVQTEAKKAPAPVNPIPTPYPNATSGNVKSINNNNATVSTSEPTTNQATKSEPLRASKSTQGNAKLKSTPQKSREAQNEKKEYYQK